MSKNDTGLGDYVLYTDLPKEYTKQRLDNTSVEYVPFLDERNNLYNELFNNLQTSPTNASILAKKNKMVSGDGLTVEAKQGIVLKNDTQISDIQLANIDEYLSNISQLGTSVIDELDKVVADFNTFGNAYIELTQSQVGSTKRYFQRHIPFIWGRIKRMEKGQIQPTHVGISQKWDAQYLNPQDLVEYPLYPNFEQIEGDGIGVKRCILHIKQAHPNFFYYGCPSYVSAVIWSELEYRIAKYNQSQFNNGFMPSGFLQLFGALSPEEAEAAVLAVEEKFTGTGNNSKLITQVLTDPSMAANFVNLDTRKEGSWTELANLARENIVTAHEWTASMAGLMTAGSLGSNQQIRAEFEIIQNTVIKPIQDQILSQWLNKTLLEAARFEAVDFGNCQLRILNNSPVSFAGDIMPSEVLTMNEKREILGFEAIEEQDLNTLNNGNNGTDTNTPAGGN